MTGEVDILVCDALLPIYRAAREVSPDQFQPLALDLLQSALKFDSGRWGMGRMTERGIDAHAEYLYREPDEMAGAYAEVKHQDEIARVATQNDRGTISATTSEVFRGKAMAGIREYTRRYEHRNSLLSTITDAQTSLKHWISLYRADEKAAFGARERTTIATLLPHLCEAQTVNRLKELTRIFPSAKNRWCCAVADFAGIVHHAESDFLDLLAAEPAPHGRRRLATTIIEGLRSHGRFAGRAIVIEGREGGGLLFLKARPVLPADKLSAREKQIARLAAKGLSHKHIAGQLGLTPATVRTHLQHIHTKLETHSFVDIVNRLSEIEP